MKRELYVDATAPVALATTDARHYASAQSVGPNRPDRLVPREVIAERNDENAVNIDEEMALLAETQLRYQALTQLLGERLSTLRTAIRGQ